MPQQELELGLTPGSRNYRAFVGYPAKYDIIAAMQFNLLTFLGLRQHHRLLDLGCGSLRAGRLFIPYLNKDHYCGIEPEEWLVREGIERETGQDLIRIKNPSFAYRADYKLTCFGIRFDFILAQSIFSHAGAHDIQRCLAEAAATLAPGGLLVASFVLDREDYAGDAWVYPTCVGYKDSTVRRIAATAGLDFLVIDWPHPNGQTWAVFWLCDKRQAPTDPTYAYQKPAFEKPAPQWVHADTGAGFFDGVWDVGEAWLAYGWARDIHRKAPAEFVIVAADAKIVASGPAGLERPDVASAYGAEFLLSGFRIRIPKPDCPPGNNLCCYAYHPPTEQVLVLSGAHSV